jgi:hypothetical protein
VRQYRLKSPPRDTVIQITLVHSKNTYPKMPPRLAE